MKCKNCGSHWGVQGGWEHVGGYVRTRKCKACGKRAFTLEVVLSTAQIKEITGKSAWEEKTHAKESIPMRDGRGLRGGVGGVGVARAPLSRVR